MAALASLLSQASVHHYDLAVMSRCAHMLSKPGWLKVFETDDAYTAAKPDIERMRRHGVECRYLDSDEIGAAQPNFNPIFKHAILHPECEQIADPQAYVAAYGEEFVRRGGALIRAEVVSLESRGGMIKAACSHTEKYEGDVFVIAAGAWSSRLSREAATRVCLDTERGYHIVVSGSAERLASSPVLWAEHAIVMSPSQAGLRVTSSVEFAGLEHKPDFRKLRRLIPQIGRAHAQPLGGVVSEWLGFRPSTPDSLPVIGHAAGAENGFLAFGHGHLGLTLGPVTGAVIADLIDGRQPCIDISPFTADRFYRA